MGGFGAFLSSLALSWPGDDVPAWQERASKSNRNGVEQAGNTIDLASDARLGTRYCTCACTHPWTLYFALH